MKINTNSIEGYENMTIEEKLKALEGYEYEDNSENLKKLLSKANSEASDYKKKLQEKMTEDEKREAERQEREKQQLAELEGYRKNERIRNFQIQYLALGYDPELAKATAEAHAEDKMDVVFANQREFLTKQQKSFEEKALQNQPNLSSGQPPQGQQNPDDMSDEDFYKNFTL